MRIGFLGNTNNYPFMLARAIRRLGHDVLFVVDSREPLNRPEHRYEDVPFPFPDWIRDAPLAVLRDWIWPNSRCARVIGLLRKCDAVIVNGLGPSLVPWVNRPAVILLTGTDLEVYGDFRNVALVAGFSRRDGDADVLRRRAIRWLVRRTISRQRKGIAAAVAVNYFPRAMVPDGDRLLDEIGVSDSRRIFFMMADLEKIEKRPPPHNSVVRTTCLTRLSWKQPRPPGTSELDHKGSDVMVRGLGLFWRRSGVRLDIRLVKKGRDVAETARLVESEGLADQVTWLEEMTQREAWTEMRDADIVFEQLGGSAVGMAGLEAMAMGRPVIANGRPEIMEPIMGAWPICQARTPEEVCAQLERLVRDPAERGRVGSAGRKCVEEHFSPDRAARICLDRLASASLT